MITHASKSMRMWQATGSTSQPPGRRATRCCSTSNECTRTQREHLPRSHGHRSVAAARDVSLIQVPNHPLAVCSLLLLDVLASKYALGRPESGLTQGSSACSVCTRSIQGVVDSTAPGLATCAGCYSVQSHLMKCHVCGMQPRTLHVLPENTGMPGRQPWLYLLIACLRPQINSQLRTHVCVAQDMLRVIHQLSYLVYLLLIPCFAGNDQSMLTHVPGY